MTIIILIVKIIPIRINITSIISINMLYELEKIKQIRQKVGLTQTQLSRLANVSQSLITKIERGNVEPSYSIAKRIFTALEEQLADKQKEILAKNICTKDIAFIKSNDTVDDAIKLMKKYAISQMPVVKEKIIIGSISEETFVKKYDQIKNKRMKVEEIMDESFPTIPEDTHITLIKDILKKYPAVILIKQGQPTGIIAKADLLKRL
jgi:predicted transcriptional regulator